MRFIFLILLSFLQTSAFASWPTTVTSGSQPASDFYVSFAVSKSAEHELAILRADFYSKKNDVVIYLSDDESVIFSVEGKDVVYNPRARENVIPYFEGAEYSVTYKRANGEAYSSRVKMISPIKIVSPRRDVKFKKSEKVEVTWHIPNGSWSGLVGWGPVQYADGQVCKTNGETRSDIKNSRITIPAHFLDQCVGDTWYDVSVGSTVDGTEMKGLNSDFKAGTSVSIILTFVD